MSDDQLGLVDYLEHIAKAIERYTEDKGELVFLADVMHARCRDSKDRDYR